MEYLTPFRTARFPEYVYPLDVFVAVTVVAHSTPMYHVPDSGAETVRVLLAPAEVSF